MRILYRLFLFWQSGFISEGREFESKSSYLTTPVPQLAYAEFLLRNTTSAFRGVARKSVYILAPYACAALLTNSHMWGKWQRFSYSHMGRARES